MAITILPSERPFDEIDFKKRLVDEYKILQDKLDKIGGFRFTIKGWSVTALIAASAAAGTAKSFQTVVAVSVGLALMLWFFFRFELEQVRLSRLFGSRVRQIEESFSILDRRKGKTTSAPIQVPYIAHEIYNQRLKRASLSTRVTTNRWRRFVGWSRIQKQADIHFYIILIFLALVLPLLPHYAAISKQIKDWRNGTHSSAPVTPPPFCGRSGAGGPECL